MEPEDAIRKRSRVSGAVGGSSAGGPDRLSSLPDCLLHTVMSSLKARQAVQTCVLSTRWRHLWRSVPCLDIDFDEFKTVPVSDNNSGSGGDHNSGSGVDNNSGSGGEDNSDSEGGDNSDSSDDGSSSSDSDTSDSHDNNHNDSEHWLSKKDWEHFTKYKVWEDFEDFSVTLMRRCNIAQLDSFRLHIDPMRAPEFGNRVAAGWLRRAMKYFTPDRASKLGLSSGSWLLKKLHLCHVLLDNHFVKRVSSVCCSLEDLELDDCTCQFQSITSNSLKTLVLKRCQWRNLSEIISPTLKTLVIDRGSNSAACVLVILAPALVYLHLALHVYSFAGGVSLNEVPSVAKALIHLWGHIGCAASSKLGGDQFKLLCSISNSINLELSGVGSTVLGKEPRFQEFKNLRNLLLDKCDLSDDFRTLVFFLRSSPILEKLTLRCCKFPNYPSKKKGAPILNKTSWHCEFPKYPSKKKGAPILNKTLWCCKFPKYPSKEKGVPILNNTSSSELRGLDLLCENLKVEIIYEYGDGPHLIWLLQRVSVNLWKDNIKLTKAPFRGTKSKPILLTTF